MAGVRGTAVLHDITLDGPLFSDWDSKVSSKPLVGELLVGIGARYHAFELSYSKTYRTDEFNGQRENQEFGSVMLQCSLCF